MPEETNTSPAMPYQAQMLQLLIENTSDYAIVMLDTQGHVALWNTGAENVLGWMEDEIVGQSATHFFTPEDRDAGVHERELRTAREQGRAEEERWHLRKDGSRFWSNSLVFPVTDGDLRGYMKIFRDLTESKRHEQELNDVNRRLEAALNVGEIGTWTWDIAANRVFADTNLARFFSVTPEDAQGGPIERYIRAIHPDDRAAVETTIAEAIQNRTRYEAEYRLVKPDGSCYQVIARGGVEVDAQGKPANLPGVVLDITTRWEAEQARTQAQAQAEHDRRLLDAVMDALPAGVMIADTNGKIVHVNAACDRIWGGTVQAEDVAAYREYVGYWHDTGKRIQPQEWAMARALQGEQCPGDLIEIERLDGGEPVVMVNSAAPIYNAAREIIGGVVAELDVTAQIRAEESLRLSEEKYRLLFNSVDQGFCHCEIILNEDGVPVDYRFLEVNPIFEEMTGLVEATGQTAYDLIPGLEDWWAQTYGRVALGGGPTRFQYGSEAMGRFFDVYAAPTGQGRFVLLFTDITARRKAEQERERSLVEIEGLNVRLARAMQEAHHRIKNNLQVIAALVEIQADELGNSQAVQRIKRHVRALAAIHDLLTQQAKTDVDTSIVSAREVLMHLIPMLQVTSGDRRITAEVEEVMLAVQKATSLSLLVSECVSNAIKHARGEVKVILSAEGKNVRLEVRDDGDGFPAGFNPRKAAHTGLELIDSTARWDLRGELRYENQDQGGGRVVVTFPLTSSVE